MGLFSKKKAKDEEKAVSDLKIDISKNGEELTVRLKGRLDTITSPDLEERLNEEMTGIKNLIFDLEKLNYISSAGLRVLLGASQEIEAVEGEMLIRNVAEPVRVVFDLTGFDTAFNIEE
ncbi:MAG TPA: anti-sigma factor antagonist [Ruminococcaceae bacterium]|nr:anti-sigma factor antagonist [Oscillospiraceae bacterium]